MGTKLVTAYDEPALTGVYKLSMLQSPTSGGKFLPRIKLSEQAVKISNPGIQQVRRFSRDGQWVADAIYDELLGCGSPCVLVDPFDPARERTLGTDLSHEDLLVPVWRNGQRVAAPPPLAAVRERTQRPFGNHLVAVSVHMFCCVHGLLPSGEHHERRAHFSVTADRWRSR